MTALTAFRVNTDAPADVGPQRRTDLCLEARDVNTSHSDAAVAVTGLAHSERPLTSHASTPAREQQRFIASATARQDSARSCRDT